MGSRGRPPPPKIPSKGRDGGEVRGIRTSPALQAVEQSKSWAGFLITRVACRASISSFLYFAWAANIHTSSKGLYLLVWLTSSQVRTLHPASSIEDQKVQNLMCQAVNGYAANLPRRWLWAIFAGRKLGKEVPSCRQLQSRNTRADSNVIIG